MPKEEATGSSNLEIGLVFLGSATIISTMLLCACFKRSRGSSLSDEHKNGHVFGSPQRLSILDSEYDDEGLRGARATSHRRLPDLPDPLLNGAENPRHSSVRSSQDTTSELYAQVEIGAVSNSFPVNPIDETDMSATFNPTPEDETHPYDKVKSNHGYSKIKKKAENPYAKVKRTDTMESETAEVDENETDTDNYDVVYTVDETKKVDSTPAMDTTALLPPPLPLPLRGSHSSLASGEIPRPPPRGRRSIVQATSNSNLNRPNSLVDQDVTAADGVETPDNPPEAVAAVQIHFSGDSQTSQDSKGYSSISVREPLANLKARNPQMNVGRQRIGGSSRQPDSLDPHYATVSDAEDSDEMYAAIAELQPIYDQGAGSDTYAKINDRSEAPPTIAASTSASPLPSLPTEVDRSSPIPPTPPSVVSLRQISSGPSRLHASTLSIASQTSGVGSPKPEKRQANSPLPPPPVHQELADRKSMNLEEMYAKVMKKKALSTHPWQVSESAGKSHRGSVDLGFLVSREGDAFLQDISRRNSVDSTPQRLDIHESVLIVETSMTEVTVAVMEEDDDEDDFRYEVLPVPIRGARKISENDPGYERIQLKSEDSFNDPRYERINLKRDGQVEPNYEIVGFQCAEASESNEPGYELVELQPRQFEDPNYESLHYSIHHNEPPYASIGRDEEELETLPEETTDELVVNNNTMPVYAQVVKSKRAMAQHNVVAVVECPASPTPSRNQDYSVSSSKNTTIIRITDNRPAFRYFSDDDTLGVPEQV